jgi:hypothetical protein
MAEIAAYSCTLLSDESAEEVIDAQGYLPYAPNGQAGLLRCIFGNPFRPVAVDPGWLTSAATGLTLQRGFR